MSRRKSKSSFYQRKTFAFSGIYICAAIRFLCSKLWTIEQKDITRSSNTFFSFRSRFTVRRLKMGVGWALNVPKQAPLRKNYLKKSLSKEKYNKFKSFSRLCILSCISTSEARYIECGGSKCKVSIDAAIRRSQISSQNNRNFSILSVKRLTDLGIKVVQ